MLQYPSILPFYPTNINRIKHYNQHVDAPCIAFYKYDGSNLRWEWSPKQGWHKFGTRRHLFDESTPLYNQAIPLFMDRIADDLLYKIKQIVKKPERITVFTEFFGSSSFAGSHELNEAKLLKVFDIFMFKKGFIKPNAFVDLMADASYAPQVIYKGPMTQQFMNDVRTGLYPVDEGVVIKGDDFMYKIKTHSYFEKLYEAANRCTIEERKSELQQLLTEKD